MSNSETANNEQDPSPTGIAAVAAPYISADVECEDLPGVNRAIPPVRIYPAQSLEVAAVSQPAPAFEHSWPVRLWLTLGSGCEWLFGLATLMVILALLAAIPVVQFLSLGYLLEVSGRIARTGRFRAGFIGIRHVGCLGSILLGTWLMLWPLRFASDIWYSAQLMAPTSGPATFLRVMLLLLASLFILHVVLAWYCGGRLRHFFWPLLAPVLIAMWILRMVIAIQVLRPLVRPIISSVSPRLLADLTRVPPLSSWFPPAIMLAAWRRGGLFVEARDAVWDFVQAMRLPFYFWLGVRGFIGAVAWLVIPALLMIGMTKLPPLVTEAGANLGAVRLVTAIGGLFGFVGALLMAAVLIYLPFLQANFARENRLVAMFDVGAVRQLFRRAPLAFWFALFITLLFALPLYLLRIEYTPREILALPSLVFVVFIYPARLLTGWAMGRATKRTVPRFVLFQWLARFAAIPVVAFYVLILFVTQYVAWDGAWSLLEQHPFLLPAPFFGL